MKAGIWVVGFLCSSWEVHVLEARSWLTGRSVLKFVDAEPAASSRFNVFVGRGVWIVSSIPRQPHVFIWFEVGLFFFVKAEIGRFKHVKCGTESGFSFWLRRWCACQPVYSVPTFWESHGHKMRWGMQTKCSFFATWLIYFVLFIT